MYTIHKYIDKGVNALKVCGLNQGHFMGASDYMSVCQSTRKVNNPFCSIKSFISFSFFFDLFFGFVL